MRNNIQNTFCESMIGLTRGLLTDIDNFKRLYLYYVSTGLGTSIDDDDDMGTSIANKREVYDFFNNVKNVTIDIVNNINTYIYLKREYDALSLSSLILDATDYNYGIIGSEIKGCITSYAALNAALITGFYNTPLYNIIYKTIITKESTPIGYTADMTGSEFKTVLSAMVYIDTYLNDNWHYTNLYKVI